MRKNRISNALNQLIGEREKSSFLKDSAKRTALPEESETIRIKICNIRILSGINILSEMLVKAIMEQNVFGKSDLLIEHPVNPDHQPELYAAGISNIVFYSRQTVLESLPEFYRTLSFQIRYMLTSIQKEIIYSKLFPEDAGSSKGILFPFHRENDSDLSGYFYLLEYIPGGRFLRITLESETDSRLRLTRIPHFTVGNIDLIHSRLDITKTSEMLVQGIVESCAHQNSEYSAAKRNYDEYITFLQKWDLPALEVINFLWNDTFKRSVLSGASRPLFINISRILFSLCDYGFTSNLRHGNTIMLDDHDFTCFVDLSHRYSCINISYFEPRTRTGLPLMLKRLPSVSLTSKSSPGAFDGIQILLIHHLTGDVLGLIQALLNMGAQKIETLWVKYAGSVEPEYREIILSLPENVFLFRGVSPVPVENSIHDRFLLSKEYSSTEGLLALEELLRASPWDFFSAMNYSAGHLFLQNIISCRKGNRKLMIIEDGGYISPLINRICLENTTVRDALKKLEFPAEKILKELPDTDLDISFAEWIRPVFTGSVEHTKNGYDALCRVEERFGKLAFPALSIAVSNYKINNESRDVVYSCINSVESIMNGMGFVLSDRTAITLGALGVLGSRCMTILSSRIDPKRLFGVDIKVPATKPEWTYAKNLSLLPEEVLIKSDLVFGFIGTSICSKEWIEKLLIKTEKREIFFASGSTKTAEFSNLTEWISKNLQDPDAKLAGQKMTINTTEIRDPKTRFHQGRSVEITFGKKMVRLHLLADTMPVNFLYYGVPSETMNNVMNELLVTGSNLAVSSRSGNPLPSKLLALDHEIDIKGNLIK